MKDLENNKADLNESKEPLNAPSQASSGFMPNLGVRELQATWEMLVAFKEAIRNVDWPGDKVQAVAMGLQMIIQMEGQYRVQMEMAKEREKDAIKQAKNKIAEMGGQINGEAASPEPAQSVH